MSLAIDPNQPIPYVLLEDRAKPPSSQRTVLFRAMSVRDHASFRREMNAAAAAEDPHEVMAGYIAAISKHVVGWSGFALPYSSPADLDAVLGPQDLADMRQELSNQLMIGAIEKKLSVLRSQSTAAASVESTDAAGA